MIAPIWTSGPSFPTQRPALTANPTPRNFTINALKQMKSGYLTPLRIPIVSATPEPAAAGDTYEVNIKATRPYARLMGMITVYPVNHPSFFDTS